MEKEPEPDIPWGVLKIMVSRDLTSDNLQEALVFVGRRLPESVKGTLTNTLAFIEALEDNGLISEDDTKYLRDVLEGIECKSTAEIVTKYDKDYHEHAKKVERLTGYHDPFFVGREREIRDCVNFLKNANNDQVRCIAISGMTGLGKTKLAAEICALYATTQGLDRMSMPFVRLQKVTTTHEMGIKILHALGLDIPFEAYEEDILFEKILQRKQDTLLLLDNADEILSPSSQSGDNFKNQLSGLVDCKNPFMKIIVTSRFSVNFRALSNKKGFLELELRPLSEVEAMKLLRKATKPISLHGGLMNAPKYLPLSDQYSKAIAEMCGNSPTLLRAVASRIRSGVPPDNILTALQKPNLAHYALQPSQASEFDTGGYGPNEDIVQRLRRMIDDLPPDLKDTLLRLSVFPTTFSTKQSGWVMEEEDASIFHLTELRQWSMLDADRDELGEDLGLGEQEQWYSMHPLVRTACLQESLQVETSMEKFHNAINHFSDNMIKIVEDIAATGNKDALAGVKKFERYRTNLMHFLDIEAGQSLEEGSKHLITGKLLPTPTQHLNLKTQERLYSLLDKFMDPPKRRLFFKRKSEMAHLHGDLVKHAAFVAWASDQNVAMKECVTALKDLEQPIQNLRNMQKSNDSELALAQCLYVRGRALFNQTDGKFKDALAALEEAVEIQKRLMGYDSSTARTVNSIGSAYFRQGNTQKSLEHHMEAWKMLEKITIGQPQKHFDAALYVMNIGTCYYNLGNDWMDRRFKEKAMLNYEQSIKYYDRAVAIQKSLGLGRTSYVSQIIKNKATSLIEMKNYEEAHNLASQALKIRADLLERYPESPGLKSDTARSYYQVGLACYEAGKVKQKNKVPIDAIEEYPQAEESFKLSLKLNFQLGYRSRCDDYDDLKEDLLSLVNRIHGAKEKAKYERFFSTYEVEVEDVETLIDNIEDAGTSVGELPGPAKKARCMMS